jgi:formate dehydrogenase major subunit
MNRRDFFKITGASAASAVILGLGLELKPIKSHAQTLKINHCKETTGICCYCAVGCG